MPDNTILRSYQKQFAYYEALGRKSLERMTTTELQFQPSMYDNSMATIVKHLHGNMLSRWTDFPEADGEKSWRRRDDEFAEADRLDKPRIMELWDAGWQCVHDAMARLDDGALGQITYIRNEGHTVHEAIIRQMTHYAYHVGQIVYLAKMQQGAQWKSLTIPRHASEKFNAEKFAQAKVSKHFTDNE